ncbi:MAG: Gfo/Idh/MocA family oxidoreductase [candidate division Zixibacteria bacterium]|nr:Gfo/Idh/MocA family oxidoreductase [candidate division Zixibacteria bacterium]
MDTVRIGFVGAGYMGQVAHLANFVNIEGCKVVALAEKRPRLAKSVADHYRVPKICETHEELCADPAIDAIVEITSDDMHAPIALDAMNAGKHVYLEKPMATHLDDARAMVEAERRNGVKLVIGYMKRYDTGVELAKRLIDGLRVSNELGPITHVRVHCFGGDWICNIGKHITTDETYPPVERRPPPGFSEQQTRDFYGINNVFCHDINLTRHLAGEIKSLKYADFSGTTNLMVFGMDGFDATMEFGRLSANFWDEEFKIYFTDGWVEVRTPPPLLRNVPAKVSVYRAGAIQEHAQPQAAWDWGFRRADEHFVQCILNDTPPRSGGADSIRDLELFDEAFRRFY